MEHDERFGLIPRLPIVLMVGHAKPLNTTSGDGGFRRGSVAMPLEGKGMEEAAAARAAVATPSNLSPPRTPAS